MVCFEELKSKIPRGYKLTKEEALLLLNLGNTEIVELFSLANTITRRYHGNIVDTCSIVNAKCSLCGEDCSFCAQSVHNHTNITPYSLMQTADLVDLAKCGEDMGATRFSIVTSGLSPNQKEFGSILHTIKQIKEKTSLSVCASIGAITGKRAAMLKDAGLTRIHHNLETSKSFFASMCSTHTYEQRINTVRIAKESGLEVCSGGIIGLGETPADRIELALALKKLNVDAVPINIITPIAGTGLENIVPPSPLEIIKTIAVYRLILPDKSLLLAGGRESGLRSLQSLALISGANGILLGNYLTTKGQSPQKDLQMIADLGLTVHSYV
ncbi:MAG: 3-methylornithine synthase [Candidatus Argoarchaeum ethanivorans]|uniref:Biotin synthase n=1 Tax=Candidatus Argoarchaeum ethanivorans TaxID=2608793 RepID=A0A811TCS9_9EURY|nr:MAG: 3-methylornithine synthase [Candidatus Argoarchaeum ethanivorans]CAD6494546.1 MAG: 3-methylornithine synthase [Candidatus Argoarchaeum ethanivorans]